MPPLYFASPRDLRSSEVAPGLRRLLIPAENASIAMIDAEARTVVDTHKHEVEEVGVVIKGSFVMVIAGEQRILTAGDTYRVPAGLSHGARVFEAASQVLTVWSPPRTDLDDR